MIVYGKNPILEALRANRPIEKVLVAHDGHPPHQVVKLCKDGNVATQGRRWTFENCPSIPPAGENLLCLDMASKAVGNCNSPNTLIFTMGDRTSVSDFAVRYYLSSANLPKECAPGTFNLLKQVSGDSTGRPIASCIAVFRVRYFDSQSYSGVVDDINNLRAIRLCLLMQVGGRMDTPMDPPNHFEQCGNITTNPEWRWYRWKLAAVGGVNYAVLQIKSGLFDTMDQYGCPTGWISDGDCCISNINYRLSGTTQNFTNRITICLRGYAPPPGEIATGVAYSRPQPGGRGYIYLIISEADGPQSSRSRVEAVWVR
jgi:hypothetical protein